MHQSRNHLTHSLSTEIIILCPPGPGEPGKRNPCNCNSHCRFSWASSWRYASRLWHLQGIFHLVLNFSSTFFIHQGYQNSASICPGNQQGWLSRPRDEFIDGGGANQPAILQGGIGLSSGQVSPVSVQLLKAS